MHLFSYLMYRQKWPFFFSTKITFIKSFFLSNFVLSRKSYSHNSLPDLFLQVGVKSSDSTVTSVFPVLESKQKPLFLSFNNTWVRCVLSGMSSLCTQGRKFCHSIHNDSARSFSLRWSCFVEDVCLSEKHWFECWSEPDFMWSGQHWEVWCLLL